MVIDINRYETQKIINALKNDELINSSIVIFEREEDDIENLNENRTEKIFYIKLSNILLNYINIIQENNIDEVIFPERYEINEETISNITDFKNRLDSLFLEYSIRSSLTDELLKRIIFSVKYFSIKEFFLKNYKKFLPTYDSMVINSTPKAKLFVETFMKELDRFASIINDISYVNNINTIPEKYINYLAQLVGYQDDVDEGLFNYITFREFIKNIIEIYRIKGTNFSMELFTGFIGFFVEINEYWFDRRMYYLAENNERNLANKNTYDYYLTSIDPRNRVINKEMVADNNISKTKNVHIFQRKINNGEDLEDLLGLNKDYRDETFTFFKTNIASFSLTPYNFDTSIDATRQALIQNYIVFLIPIFIQKYINFNIPQPPIINKTDTIYLYDLDRINYNEWVSGTVYSENDIVQKNLDVYSCILEHTANNKTIPGEEETDSLHWKLIGRTNDFSGGEIPEFMFHIYGDIYLINKDIIKSFEEQYGGEGFVDRTFQEFPESIITMGRNFSYIKGDQKRNSYAFKEYQDDSVSIQSMTASSNTIVILDNDIYGISYFQTGDKVEVYSSVLQNRGIYTISSSSVSAGNINIVTTENFNIDQASGGFILPYREDWKYENSRFLNFFGVEELVVE